RVVEAGVDGVAVEDGLEGLPGRAVEGAVEEHVDRLELRRALRRLPGVAAPSLRGNLRGRGVRPEQRQDRGREYDGGTHGPHGPAAGCFHRSSSADGGSTVRR